MSEGAYSETGSNYEEAFKFGEEMSNGTVWSFDDSSKLTDSEIQEELKATFSLTTLKDKNEEIMKIPSVYDIHIKYEKFLESKSFSFLTLSLHPYFKGKIDVTDIKAVDSLRKVREKRESNTSLVFLISTIIGSNILNKRRMFGLTNAAGFKSAFLMYCIVPRMVADIADQWIYYPILQKQTEVITKKYNFQQEALSNPYFRKAYNDIIQHRDGKKKTSTDNQNPNNQTTTDSNNLNTNNNSSMNRQIINEENKA